MRSSLLYCSLFALWTTLQPLLSSAAPAADCSSRFAQVEPIAHQAAQTLSLKYSRHEFPTWRNGIVHARDAVRKQLQYWHGHSYPVISLEDATPINAYAWASDTFGSLSAEQKALVNLDTIRTDLEATLKGVENYPGMLHDFIDETSTMAAQSKTIESYLGKDNIKSFGLNVELPVIKTGPDGKEIITSQVQYFGSDVEMKLYLKELNDKLADRTGNNFFSLNETNSLGMAQAINVKRLETYRHELLRQQSLHPSQPMPADAKATLDRINALYVTPGSKALKDDFRPPIWAWDRLGWMQLHGEVNAVFQKDIPALEDAVQNNQIIQFITELPAEDRRALGITNAAEAATIFAKTKWINTVVAASTGAGGGIEALRPMYEKWIGDRRSKEACAAFDKDVDFVDCAQEYLKTKFPVEVIEALLQNRAAFLNPEGKVTDKKVLAEIQDLLKRRKSFVEKRNFQLDEKSVLSEFITSLMSKGDMSSIAYRKAILEAKTDDEFGAAILGSQKPKIESYLAFEYPLYFAREKDTIAKVLKLTFGAKEQVELLEKLKKSAPDLAAEVTMLLTDRNAFKQGLPLSIDNNPYYSFPSDSRNNPWPVVIPSATPSSVPGPAPSNMPADPRWTGFHYPGIFPTGQK